MPNASHPFTALLEKRVAVLDGAMGTTLQRLGLSEADYRGERFRNWKGKDLKGAIELLLLTKPEAVEHVHEEYLRAGADVIETNTFSATTIGLQEFLFDGKPNNGRKDPEFFESVVNDVGLRETVREINNTAARMAREAADRVSNETGEQRFVAGALGPLPVTASLSPDVNDPGFRAVTFDQIKQSYRDQIDALLAGGLLSFFVAFNILEAMLPSMISRVAPVRAKGAALGVYNTTQAFGLFLGGALGGWLAKNQGAGTVFVAGAGLVVLWLAAAATMAPVPLRRTPAPEAGHGILESQ